MPDAAPHPSSSQASPGGWGIGLERIGLTLLFLPASVGAVAFGAVRISEIGPLAVLVFLGLALFGLRLTLRDAEAPPAPPALGWMLLFLLYAGALVFFSSPVYPARVKFLMLCTAPAAYVMWSAMAGRGARLGVAWAIWLALVAAIGVYAIVLHHLGSRQVLWMVRPAGYGMRASGTYACPNHFAHLAIVAVCAGLALSLARGGGGRWARGIGAAAALVLLYPIFLSRSRAAALGLGAGLSVMALLAAFRRGRRWVWGALIAVPLALAAAGAALWNFSPIWRQRFGEAIAGIHNGLDFRPICWKSTIEMIRLRPWWGWGGGSFAWAEPAFQKYGPDRIAVYAHNEPLHLAMEYGLLGFGILAVAAAAWLVRAVRLALRSEDRVAAGLTIGAVGAVVASLVHGLFDYNLHLYANSHSLLLLMGAAMARHARNGEIRRRTPWTAGRRRAVGAALAAAGLALGAAMTRTTVSHFIERRGEAAQEHAVSIEDHRDVIALYRRALRWDPGNPDAWRELGRVYKNLADTFPDAAERDDWMAAAFDAYRRAARINPLDPATLHGFAQLHRMRGEPEAALKYLQQMVALQPKRHYFHRQLAFQYERMKRYEEALAAFETARKLGDRSTEVRLSIPRMRARIRAQASKRPPAEKPSP